MKVPLLDLKAQYNSIKKDIDEALIRVAESQYFILGPEVEKLEKSIGDYIQSKYTVGVIFKLDDIGIMQRESYYIIH